MAPTRKQAWLPQIEVLWHGDLSDKFRKEVSALLGQELSDAAWIELNQITRSYSWSLNREYAAAPLVDQKKSVLNLEIAAEQLIDAIEEADRPEMGTVVSNRLAEKWDDLYDHGTEFDRHVEQMTGDIAYILGAAGHGAPEEQASQCISDWQWRGMLVRPSMPADFRTLLGEFRDAIRVFYSGLQNGNEHFEEVGNGWIEFIGRLTEWAVAFDLPKWVSHSEQYGGAGQFTYLVKAINEQIPERFEPDGSRSAKQMRRPQISDSSLAKSISETRNKYESRRLVPETGD